MRRAFLAFKPSDFDLSPDFQMKQEIDNEESKTKSSSFEMIKPSMFPQN